MARLLSAAVAVGVVPVSTDPELVAKVVEVGPVSVSAGERDRGQHR